MRKGILSDEQVLSTCPEMQSIPMNRPDLALRVGNKTYYPQNPSMMVGNLPITNQQKENMIENFVMRSMKQPEGPKFNNAPPVANVPGSDEDNNSENTEGVASSPSSVSSAPPKGPIPDQPQNTSTDEEGAPPVQPYNQQDEEDRIREDFAGDVGFRYLLSTFKFKDLQHAKQELGESGASKEEVREILIKKVLERVAEPSPSSPVDQFRLSPAMSRSLVQTPQRLGPITRSQTPIPEE